MRWYSWLRGLLLRSAAVPDAKSIGIIIKTLPQQQSHALSMIQAISSTLSFYRLGFPAGVAATAQRPYRFSRTTRQPRDGFHGAQSAVCLPVQGVLYRKESEERVLPVLHLLHQAKKSRKQRSEGRRRVLYSFFMHGRSRMTIDHRPSHPYYMPARRGGVV